MIRVAIAGLGGFAQSHHRAIRALEAEGLCQLVATCDPFLSADYTDYSEMLAKEQIDLVCLPTPVFLHAEQHRLAVDRGVQVYLEKPPTLWWPELLEMIELDRTAKRQTQVGFNFIGDPFRQALKRRVVSGEFGNLVGASLHAVWPRNSGYYGRNRWAGQVQLGGQWVLDSCIGNALAHYVQNILWMCGPVDGIASVESVQAKLFRGHPISSFDTVMASIDLDGVDFRIAATHLGNRHAFEHETLRFESAEIIFETWNHATIRWEDGILEELYSPFVDNHDVLCHNLRETFAYGRGERERPITTLEDSRSFVALHSLCFAASGGIETLEGVRIEDGYSLVEGIEDELVASLVAPPRGLATPITALENFQERWFAG